MSQSEDEKNYQRICIDYEGHAKERGMETIDYILFLMEQESQKRTSHS